MYPAKKPGLTPDPSPYPQKTEALQFLNRESVGVEVHPAAGAPPAPIPRPPPTP
jgi:hypothetical protein